MERDLDRLAGDWFDVLVIGGGAFGAAVARDAAQRGLRTALVEKGDFCSGASANSFRMVHGGIRYLQHLDLLRARRSAMERSVFLATAPHLVRPLPIVLPTRGAGIQGRALLRAGFLAYDLLTLDRNRRIPDPARRIPRCRSLSQAEVLKIFPELDGEDLTGGGVFHDAQMLHPARLVLAMLRSAHADGAALANYTEATGFLTDGTRVNGARVVDREGGVELEVRARTVVVAAGAWTDGLLARGSAAERLGRAVFSRDLCLITDMPARDGYALAVPGVDRDPDAVVSRSARHLFVVPWLGRLIVGVWHQIQRPSPDKLQVGEDELNAFVRQVSDAVPGLGLSRDRIVAHNTGLVLVEGSGDEGTTPRFGKRSRLVDHRRHQAPGLVSLVGVRYTTARHDAARALDRVIDQLPGDPGPCHTDTTPVFGGGIESVAEHRRSAAARWPALPEAALDTLCRCYGTAVRDVMAYATCEDLAHPLGGSSVLGAEVVHAVRREMALHLDDVILRRTELGAHGVPDESALDVASQIMAREMEWSETRRLEELSRAIERARGPATVVPQGPPAASIGALGEEEGPS